MKKIKKATLRKQTVKKLASKPKNDRQVVPKLTPVDYQKWLNDHAKFPMSSRMAAELFRSGITVRDFEARFHRSELLISKHVQEVLIQLEQGKLDEERVPPFLPVYLRVATVKTKATDRKGRPTPDVAEKILSKFKEQLISSGWTEADFKDACEGVNVRKTEPKVFKVVKKPTAPIVDDDDVPVKPRAKPAPVAHKPVVVLKKGDLLKRDTDECVYCAHKLNGLIVVKRTETTVEKMHPSCYYMNEVPAAELVDGFTTLDAATGLFYKWQPANGGWVKQEPKIEGADDDEESTTEPSVQVPASKDK